VERVAAVCASVGPSVVAVGYLEYVQGTGTAPINRIPEVMGSGFVIAPDIVATNAHVIDGLPAGKLPVIACRDKTLAAWGWYSGEVVHRAGFEAKGDPMDPHPLLFPDVALIRVTGQIGAQLPTSDPPPVLPARTLELQNQCSVVMGDEVAILGFPLGGTGGQGFGLTPGGVGSLGGFRCSLTHGYIACVHRLHLAYTDDLKPIDDVFHVIEIDADINPGNSGGPVVSVETGQIIAMATWIQPGFTGRSWGYPSYLTAVALLTLAAALSP
jgi:S1-C subfamily serine protease